MCNIKTVQDMYQYIEIPSACLQQTLHVAKVILPFDFANTFIWLLSNTIINCNPYPQIFISERCFICATTSINVQVAPFMQTQHMASISSSKKLWIDVDADAATREWLLSKFPEIYYFFRFFGFYTHVEKVFWKWKTI